MLLGLICLLIVGASATGELSKCEKVASLAAWTDHNTVVETTLKTLAGTWTSEGCETRPGPEYVLRSYTFNSDGTYFLIQHHYWDDSCSSPKLTVKSHGKIQIRNSIIQPESVNGFIKHTNITIIPQDNAAAEELDRQVSTECPGQFWQIWKRNQEHVVFDGKQERRATFNLWSQSYQLPINRHPSNKQNLEQAAGDIYCLGSLKWTFNELKLLKVQLRPLLPHRKFPKQMEMELLLGDIHSNKKRREFYSPTSFQTPLLKQTRGENITIRGRHYQIKNTNVNPMSNMITPPHLNEKPHLPPYIWGEWTSSRCEIRPLDVYLLRRFSFDEEDQAWVGAHKFFADPFCVIPKFTVTAYGRLTLPGPSEELKGATNIDFGIERATLTAFDYKIISEMRLQGVCGLGEWVVNVPKELRPTNGCVYLGIFIPSIRFDVVKVEMDYRGSWLLFLGQADTNNLPTGHNERPTAFQLPMVKCGEVPAFHLGLRDGFEGFYFSSAGNFKQIFFLIGSALFIIGYVFR